MVVLPVVLSWQSIIPILTKIFKPQDQTDLITIFFNNIIFIVYLIEAIILFSIIFFILYYYHSNIKRRKTGLIRIIKKEIQLKNSFQHTFSNYDLFNGMLLIKKCERINNIHSFSWSQWVMIIIINLVLPIIFLLLGYFFR
jgi:hypothetical protein